MAKPPPENYRLTFDHRPVHKVTETTPWPVPHVEFQLLDVRGSTAITKIDFCSGYQQLPLGVQGQRALSSMTPQGVQKPRRTTEGGKKCGPNFHS